MIEPVRIGKAGDVVLDPFMGHAPAGPGIL